MEEDLKNKNSEPYKVKLKVAMLAFESGCVIYSKTTQKSYTPREFMDSDEIVEVKTFGLQDYSNFTLIYPEQAIGRKLEDLRKAQQDFDTFMLKMLGAFKLSPKESKNKKP